MKLDTPSALIIAGVSILLAGCDPENPSNSEERQAMPERLMPPVADVRPHVIESPHGRRTDDYYWLRDDSRSDDDVLAYLRAENAYKNARLAHLAPLRRRLFDEINGRIQKDDSSVPYRYRGHEYYTRYEGDGEYPIHARRRAGSGSPEEVLLDVNVLAAGRDFYRVADYEVTQDGSRLAYAEDTTGRRQYTIRFRDIASGETLADELPGTAASFVWADDNRTLFWVENDPVTLRAARVRRHVLGTDAKLDPIVYEESDDSFYVDLDRSGDDRFIMLTLDSTLSTETRYLQADQPAGLFATLIAREENHEYDADHIDGRWVIRTNAGAVNFRLVTAPDGRASDRSAWREIVAHRDDAMLHDFELFEKYLVISERVDGLRRLRVLTHDGDELFVVASDEPAYAAFLDDNPEQDSEWLRYSYSSLKTPTSIFDVNMRTRERRLRKQDKVLGGFDAANYETARIIAPAKDGAGIPVSLVYRKGLRRDGTAPLLQYGYGAYGYSLEPDFDDEVLSLLDRGFLFAIAHVRGGQELGRAWYDGGRLLNKRNTFTDFIAVTEHLVAEGYCDPAKIVASGGSAGGLLMGAVANLRPDLYRVILADVPFVDAVTTMLDESIPLTTNEFDEWGDPRRRDHYEYMLSYSPYDNVERQDYPAMIVTTGLWDSQVQYFEPAKWVARLRARKTDDRPLLLHINMDAGHGGRSGRFRANEELAMQYALILDQLDLTDAR